ncbi:MAG TPA: hypothetical protein VKV24_16140 [Casimicrobiaceae bacterium]|nr:hypothetical protein [Casimicrobiaceae bacterium]
MLPTALLAVAAFVNAALPAVAADNAKLQSSTTPGSSQSRQVRDYTDQTLAKIVPGHTTKAEVEAMFGKPWRDTELDEEDVMPGDPSVEVWEYRGWGAQGAYRVHIQFDKRDATTLIAKIPEKTGRAVARVARPTAASGKP